MTAFKVETNGFVWTKTSTGFTALGFRDQSELSPHFTSLVSANQVSRSESVKIVKKESFVALSCNCCQCTVSIGQWIYILNPKDNFRTNKWHTGQGMFDCSKSRWAQCITGPVGHLHLHCLVLDGNTTPCWLTVRAWPPPTSDGLHHCNNDSRDKLAPSLNTHSRETGKVKANLSVVCCYLSTIAATPVSQQHLLTHQHHWCSGGLTLFRRTNHTFRHQPWLSNVCLDMLVR